MKIYWTLNSYPELQGLPKLQQIQLVKDSQRAMLRRPRNVGIFALSASIGLLGLIIPSVLVDLAVVRWLWMFLWMGFWTVSFHLITAWIMHPFLVTRRAAMEQDSRDADSSSSVPPAF